MKRATTYFADARIENKETMAAVIDSSTVKRKSFSSPRLTRHAQLPLITAGSIDLYAQAPQLRIGESGKVGEEGYEINAESSVGI